MKYLISIFIFTLLSCDNSHKLIGHWHISPENNSKEIFYSLDILNDTIAYLNTNSIYGKIKGTHHKKDKIWFFPGQCGSSEFKYSIKGNELYFENYLGNWIGIRNDKCDKLFDFKHQDIKLSFNLPILTKKRLKYSPKEIKLNSLMPFIIIGKSNNDNSFKLQLNDKICSIEDLPNWISYIKESHTLENYNRIIIRIVADKNIPIKEMKPIIDLLKMNNLKIRLTLLKENYKIEEEIFEYVKIDKLNFKENKLLKEILE